MKSITAAIALAVACISTPASAMNSWDWANMFNAVANVANAVKPAAPAVVIVAPAVVPVVICGTGNVPNSLGGCDLVVPPATVKNVAPAIIDNGNGDQAAFIAARNAGLGIVSPEVTAPDAVEAAKADAEINAPVVVVPVVKTPIVERVCVRTDGGGVVCGTPI